MKIIEYMIVVVVLLFASGCLKFGNDIETTNPTAEQIRACRAEMYLNPSVEIIPLGFKLLSSGIDDAIWLKFKTKASNISEVFDKNNVDTSEFEPDAWYVHEEKDLTWWDVKDKKLFGGQVSLPNARVMNVGAVKIDQGYLIYIMWHET